MLTPVPSIFRKILHTVCSLLQSWESGFGIRIQGYEHDVAKIVFETFFQIL
jgi:hypothetical protein